MSNFLNLPKRESKPRDRGLNILIDNGYPLRYFEDVLTSFSSYIDFVKFGWCTAYITPNLEQKIQIATQNNIKVFFGGTFFEKALQQNKLSEYVSYLKKFGLEFMEISNGTIDINNTEKASYIRTLAKDFQVFSEVGYKDQEKSQELSPYEWIEYIQEDLNSGAYKVITEARESGSSGICRSNGELRYGLIKEIIHSDIPQDKLIFEAPNKSLQTYFISHVGANVNLANLAFADVIGVETLRLGLRSDTLLIDLPE